MIAQLENDDPRLSGLRATIPHETLFSPKEEEELIWIGYTDGDELLGCFNYVVRTPAIVCFEFYVKPENAALTSAILLTWMKKFLPRPVLAIGDPDNVKFHRFMERRYDWKPVTLVHILE